MKFLGLVWATLKRKKLRTILTLLSITVAFVLFGFLCALREGLRGGVSMAGKDRIVVRHKVSIIQSLPQAYKQRIATTPGVTSVVGHSWFGGIHKDPKDFVATIAVDPESYLDMYPEIVLPEDQRQEWFTTRNGAIIGKSLSKRLEWKIGDVVPFTSPIWGQPEGESHWAFKIVGIYDSNQKNVDTSGLLFRHDFFEEGRERGKGQIGWFVVRIANPDQATEVARAIDEQFANSPYETKAEPEGVMAAGFANQLGNIGKIVIAILSAVFFTILLVAGNTMAQSVRERTEEIGVLKAMGFTNERVLFLVLLESCVIALLGGGVGLLLALVVVQPIPGILPVLYFPPRDLAIGVGVAILLGIVAGIIPAVQAMRLRIAVALRRGG